MKMNKQLLWTSFVLTSLLVFACKPVETISTHYTRVHSLAELDSMPPQGFIYSLPRNRLEFTITAKKTAFRPGPYHAYAKDMLGIEHPIEAIYEKWEIIHVDVKVVEEADPEQYYVAEANGLALGNAFRLREYGLILDPSPSRTNYMHTLPSDASEHREVYKDRGVFQYSRTVHDTAYRTLQTDTAFIRIPYLQKRNQTMSMREQARQAADNLLALREGKLLILTGDATVFPQDEAPIKEINQMDREYTALFAGKTFTETHQFHYEMVPDKDMISNPLILFRFTPGQGILPLSDMRGKPMAVEIVSQQLQAVLQGLVYPEINTETLYYRIPETVEVRLTDGENLYFNKHIPIYQLGYLTPLPANILFRPEE